MLNVPVQISTVDLHSSHLTGSDHSVALLAYRLPVFLQDVSSSLEAIVLKVHLLVSIPVTHLLSVSLAWSHVTACELRYSGDELAIL